MCSCIMHVHTWTVEVGLIPCVPFLQPGSGGTPCEEGQVFGSRHVYDVIMCYGACCVTRVSVVCVHMCTYTCTVKKTAFCQQNCKNYNNTYRYCTCTCTCKKIPLMIQKLCAVCPIQCTVSMYVRLPWMARKP